MNQNIFAAEAGQDRATARLASFAQKAALVLFGVILPVAILAHAYFGLMSLRDAVTGDLRTSGAAQTLKAIQPSLRNGNDYGLASLLAAEHTNQAVVINKQVMKVAIMQVGFAVISLGLMLIVLGITDGGGHGKLGLGELSFDFKTGSTGVLVFVIGAAMATAGGVLKNDYKTVPIPTYVYERTIKDDGRVETFWRECRVQAGADYAACFANTYEHYITKVGQ